MSSSIAAVHTVVAQTSSNTEVVGWPVVVAALALVGLVVALSWWLGLGVERELVEATVRAAIQLLAVGALFTLIFESSYAALWSWLWVVLMSMIATRVVVSRAKRRIDTLAVVAAATIMLSAVVAIAVTFGFGVFDFDPVALVVIAGITIGNAVPSAVLGVNQSVGICRDRRGELEAVLALGFDRRQSARFMAPRAAKAALIPQVERTKVVGLIALPGAMTGLLLAGVDPVDAVVIQLLVMYLVLGTAAICVVGVVASVTRAAVTARLELADWVRDPE